MTQKYTVILRRPWKDDDGLPSYYGAHVEAESAFASIEVGRKQLLKVDREEACELGEKYLPITHPGIYELVMVLGGHVKFLLFNFQE